MNRAEKRRQRKLAEKAAKNASSAELLDRAMHHHNAGRLSEAEKTYQYILQKDPNHPVALHLRGVVAHQVGKNDIAADLIGKALQLKPDYVEALNNLGLTNMALGRLDDAVSNYHKALILKPDFAEAHNNLGSVFQTLGKLETATTSYHKALDHDPDFGEAHYNLGTALKGLGRLDQAATSYRKALTLMPGHVEAHNNLGSVFQAMGQLDDAVSNFQKAVELRPDFAEAHNNLGGAFQILGKLEMAITSYQKALAIRPDFAEAHNSLGNGLAKMGKLDEAVIRYHRALALKPTYASAHINLAHALQDLGKYEQAVKSYHQGLALNRKLVDVQYNLGTALQEIGRQEEAAEAYMKILHHDATSINLLSAISQLPTSLIDIDLFALLENAAPKPDQTPREFKAKFAFTTAMACHNSGRYTQAWDNLIAANNLADKTHEQAFCDEMLLNQKILADIREHSVFSKLPDIHTDSIPQSLFILGPSRAGKTLCEYLISSLDAVKRGYEDRVLENATQAAFQSAGLPDSENLNILPTELEAVFLEKYLKELKKRAGTASVFTSTRPGHVINALRAAVILPHVRFVFVKRDFNDITLRIFMKNYQEGNFFATKMKTIREYVRWYEEMIDALVEKLPRTSLVLQYEDIIADPQVVLESVAELCGISASGARVPVLGDDRGVSDPYHEFIAAERAGSAD